MSIDNLPEDSEEIIDIIAKAGYLKVETELGEIKLNSHNSVEIQPKGTPFGAKIKVEENGTVTPTLTFDSKKLREPSKKINAKEILDQAIEDYLNEVE